MGDVVKLVGGNAWKHSDYDEYGRYLVVTITNVTGDQYIRDDIGNHINCDTSNCFILQKDDILISLTGNVGRVSRMSGVKAVLNQRVGKIIFINDKIDNNFLFSILSNPDFEKQMDFEGQGAAQKNISNTNVLSYDIKIPSLPEQRLIGSFFRTLDELVESQEARVKKLRSGKYALLSLLFPGEEKVPRLRFPGFEDEWRECRLDEILVEKRELAQNKKDELHLSCAIDGIFLKSDYFTNYQGKIPNGCLSVEKNDLILSAQNLHLGNANVNLCFEHGIISPAYKTYTLKNCDPKFIHAWIKKDTTKNLFIRSTETGASSHRKNVDWDRLYSQRILIPSLSEQRLIGSLFRALDNLIESEEFRLRILKGAKKALLSGMFV